MAKHGMRTAPHMWLSTSSPSYAVAQELALDGAHKDPGAHGGHHSTPQSVPASSRSLELEPCRMAAELPTG
eukprot:CAMPEP_0178405522 /NCGR_PEP_ID=MMETSP0689_2-20121128/18443_1 /TAXON_ID=160604 /ORGANISM="Amphidinium massartii, Strain CS-259" /LENGTH=70 /DNA_ID=CAMNT_0020026541 /DNA_START=90 /DNA_END=302 /DNA_ORIENTATION=-